MKTPTVTNRWFWSLYAGVGALAFVVVLTGWPPARIVAGETGSSGEPWLPPLKGEERAILTDAPHVPPPIERGYATRVLVELETVEVTKELAPGVEYTFWTFGGSVPGKFIRVRQGDEVELRLSNAESSITPHNIDLHAVTGPGGGAKATITGAGQATSFTFRALNPGLYVYHCAVAPVGMHVANGMYGLILVEPEEGLSEVEREFYVMQGEFYTEGAHGEKGLQPFSYAKALAEDADYVVFNGRVGSLAGEGTLQVRRGERVRLFVGNGGPSLSSAFHVIGEIFDRVYVEGGSMLNENVQTTLVPPGGSAIVEFRADVPGTYVMVDHAILRAFDKGANGLIQVSGLKNDIFREGDARCRSVIWGC